jgi:hypothetical protein
MYTNLIISWNRLSSLKNSIIKVTHFTESRLKPKILMMSMR